jgi:RecA-family ATPase
LTPFLEEVSLLDYQNPIIDILEAEEKPPDWLVPDLLLQGSLIALAGEPGTGKSYLSYTIGLAIAAGWPALGGLVPKMEPRRVLYFDQENGQQDRDKYLRRSFIGLKNAQGKAPSMQALFDNFFPTHFVLGGDNWLEMAEEYVLELKPHLMVFDTATPCFNIQDENHNGEAAKAVAGIRHLMKLTTPTCSAIVLKHAKMRTEKGGRRTMRGGKHWEGAVDGTMFQVKAAGRPRKDGLSLTRLEPAKTRAYGLRQTIYITPRWTDEARSGLVLDGSYKPDSAHKTAEEKDEDTI